MSTPSLLMTGDFASPLHSSPGDNILDSATLGDDFEDADQLMQSAKEGAEDVTVKNNNKADVASSSRSSCATSTTTDVVGEAATCTSTKHQDKSASSTAEQSEPLDKATSKQRRASLLAASLNLQSPTADDDAFPPKEQAGREEDHENQDAGALPLTLYSPSLNDETNNIAEAGEHDDRLSSPTAGTAKEEQDVSSPRNNKNTTSSASCSTTAASTTRSPPIITTLLFDPSALSGPLGQDGHVTLVAEIELFQNCLLQLHHERCLPTERVLRQKVPASISAITFIRMYNLLPEYCVQKIGLWAGSSTATSGGATAGGSNEGGGANNGGDGDDTYEEVAGKPRLVVTFRRTLKEFEGKGWIFCDGLSEKDTLDAGLNDVRAITSTSAVNKSLLCRAWANLSMKMTNKKELVVVEEEEKNNVSAAKQAEDGSDRGQHGHGEATAVTETLPSIGEQAEVGQESSKTSATTTTNPNTSDKKISCSALSYAWLLREDGLYSTARLLVEMEPSLLPDDKSDEVTLGHICLALQELAKERKIAFRRPSTTCSDPKGAVHWVLESDVLEDELVSEKEADEHRTGGPPSAGGGAGSSGGTSTRPLTTTRKDYTKSSTSERPETKINTCHNNKNSNKNYTRSHNEEQDRGRYWNYARDSCGSRSYYDHKTGIWRREDDYHDSYDGDHGDGHYYYRSQHYGGRGGGSDFYSYSSMYNYNLRTRDDHTSGRGDDFYYQGRYSYEDFDSYDSYEYDYYNYKNNINRRHSDEDEPAYYNNRDYSSQFNMEVSSTTSKKFDTTSVKRAGAPSRTSTDVAQLSTKERYIEDALVSSLEQLLNRYPAGLSLDVVASKLWDHCGLDLHGLFAKFGLLEGSKMQPGQSAERRVSIELIQMLQNSRELAFICEVVSKSDSFWIQPTPRRKKMAMVVQ
ncbi:unnamed protein product [Amoebophrya sp. A25]|nr:unnamed protein product [Amoebophrya sp. A25]|eukprot:GSA25T00010050001.1